MSASRSADGRRSTPSGRPYAGVSAEERREDRRRRLLSAAYDLLGTRGVSSTGVREICAAAEVTSRYFYESFDGLDDLVDQVIEDTIGRVRERVGVAAAQPATASGSIRGVLAEFVDMVREDPRVGRLLIVETFGQSGGLNHRRQEWLDVAVDLAEPWLSARAASLPPPRPTSADIHLSAIALAGASSEMLLAWLEGRLSAPPARIVEHLAQLHDRAADLRSGRR